jgi:hypothetical protein
VEKSQIQSDSSYIPRACGGFESDHDVVIGTITEGRATLTQAKMRKANRDS